MKTEGQKKGIRNTVIVLLLIVTVFMILFMNKMLSPRILSMQELRANGAIMFEKPRMLEPIELISHTGDVFTKEDLQGKWTLAFFGFANCPDICPMALAKLSQVEKNLDEDIAEQVQVILVTVDPARDTAEVLSQYVPAFHPDFVGITGEFLDIMRLAQNLNVAFNKVPLPDTERSKNNYTIDHTGNIILINPYGDYHGFFKPPFELAKLKVTLSSIITQGVTEK